MKKSFFAMKRIAFATLFSFGAFTAFSQDLTDNTIKKNVTTIQDPLKQVIALQPRTYEYKTSEYNHLKFPGGRQFGFIAEEFQQVFPGMVYRKPYTFMSGKNSYRDATVKTIDLQALIPVLTAAIQEQQRQIDQLKAEVEALKKR